MSVAFNIKCKSPEEMYALRNAICRGLHDSSDNIVDEDISICELQDDAFTLIIGKSNEYDIEYDLHSEDLLER